MMKDSNIDVTSYRPIYKTLKIRALQIAKYQRKLNYSDCKKYKKNFDWNLVGVLLVSYRDGVYYIVDGQHRSVMLKMIGVEDVLCQVIEGLTYEEEAALFKKYNTMRKALGRSDLLVADLESGEDRATRIVSIAAKHGYCFDRMGDLYGTKGKVKIEAVDAVERAYDTLGDEGYDYMLELINSTWPSNRTAVKRGVITGMTRFIKKYPNNKIDAGNFIKKLGCESPDSILREADLETKYTSGSDKPESTARIIWNKYNKGLPVKKRLPYTF